MPDYIVSMVYLQEELKDLQLINKRIETLVVLYE